MRECTGERREDVGYGDQDSTIWDSHLVQHALKAFNRVDSFLYSPSQLLHMTIHGYSSTGRYIQPNQRVASSAVAGRGTMHRGSKGLKARRAEKVLSRAMVRGRAADSVC